MRRVWRRFVCGCLNDTVSWLEAAKCRPLPTLHQQGESQYSVQYRFWWTLVSVAHVLAFNTCRRSAISSFTMLHRLFRNTDSEVCRLRMVCFSAASAPESKTSCTMSFSPLAWACLSHAGYSSLVFLPGIWQPTTLDSTAIQCLPGMCDKEEVEPTNPSKPDSTKIARGASCGVCAFLFSADFMGCLDDAAGLLVFVWTSQRCKLVRDAYSKTFSGGSSKNFGIWSFTFHAHGKVSGSNAPHVC